ncbi:CCA tRNA nucleotidyltransferase [PVC group bacterium]|nr:CCA tRNA nucleotidyltransferase [PVC group bacterium]
MPKFRIPRDARDIINKLKKRGYKAYLVGGCVRDLVMKCPPIDYDITTDAHPDDIRKIFKKCNFIGAKFGVVRVIVNKKEYELATFRKDIGYRDGRHPTKIRFTNEKEDVLRRDFTVNGLLYDIDKKSIIDYSQGQKDIKKRLIRTIGEPAKRFKEDYLRMLRAVRFSVQLKFKMAPQTLRAIKSCSKNISKISAERIRDELIKILTGPDPEKGLILLQKSGLLKHILPEIELMIGVKQPPQFHKLGDVFNHTLGLFSYSKNLSCTLAFGALLHDVGKPKTQTIKDRIRFDGHVEIGCLMAHNICMRLKLPLNTTEQIGELVKNHMRFIDVKKMRESTLKRFLRMDHFDDHLELHRLDCLASHGDISNWRYCRKKLKQFKALSAKEVLRPPPLISGHDLIRMGLRPGPQFKIILNELETLQLESKLSRKQDALNYVKSKYVNN